jgi:hypothetical protein
MTNKDSTPDATDGTDDVRARLPRGSAAAERLRICVICEICVAFEACRTLEYRQDFMSIIET